MSSKSFTDLTETEAVEIVKDIAETSESEDEVRQRLSSAGFDGSHADVVFVTHDTSVCVDGPHEEVIAVY